MGITMTTMMVTMAMMAGGPSGVYIVVTLIQSIIEFTS